VGWLQIFCHEIRRVIRHRFSSPEPLNEVRRDDIQSNMKHFASLLPLVISVALMVGCASDFQSTESGSSASYDYSETSNDSPSVSVSQPDTTAQDAIDRANQQMANDAANAAAQQQFLAGMAAAQETMNNANNQAPSN
jgi:uncharacterized lipoprotein YajG